MHRRALLLSTAAWPIIGKAAGTTAAARAAEPDAASILRRGGVAVLMRHAHTSPGVGDPPGFRLAVCATQRNLSDAGRESARRAGAWFANQRLVPGRVRSSAWCRCLDTARLAFGRVEPWPALNSFFADRDAEPTQSAELKAALAGLRPGRFEVWVTHQINISAFTGSGLGMGDAVIAAVERGAVVVRGRIAAV